MESKLKERTKTFQVHQVKKETGRSISNIQVSVGNKKEKSLKLEKKP